MIFSHVLYQLSYLAYREVPCRLRTIWRDWNAKPQKSEYNTRVFEARSLKQS